MMSSTTRVFRPEWLVIVGRAARSRRGAIGLTIAGIVFLIAFVGPWVAPYSPITTVTEAFASPSWAHPLGADGLGRDVFSRVLAGGWKLLIIAGAATTFGMALGVALGVTAAYYGRATDGLIMRVVDVFLAFPQLVFGLLLVSLIGPEVWLIVVAVGISHAAQVARVIRSVSIDVCERNFVKAVELMDVPTPKVIIGEVIPNLVSVVMVDIGLRFTYSIMIIAGLSFLGFGIQPPEANWGLMIDENRIGLLVNPWAVVVPVALVALVTIGLSTFTDAIARASLGVNRPAEELAMTSGIVLDDGKL
ncbi:peptide/nickel transport system permease protein [Rhodococcus sp. 27YEA15]|uniref:ABC transporter permease n=1 Tax=Rhodococcus sp. 27YEA15 TaxID=3156259 RepID=UPI003C7CDB5D